MYRIVQNGNGSQVIQKDNGWGDVLNITTTNPDNPDYAAYEAWVKDGNVAQIIVVGIEISLPISSTTI